MQRFAFSKDGMYIEATDALHGVDHVCPECHGNVRVRRGEERSPHFFHRTEGSSCHLRQKEGIHRAVQTWLLHSLGEENCTCECYFPTICRVADLAFHSKKIIFEVQVSPITPDEAMNRTLDYWGIGWHVIWLLHAVRYGKSHASPFEKILLGVPHYFTDIGYKSGCIWDELSSVRGSRRVWYTIPPLRKKIDIPSIEILRDPTALFSSSRFPKTAYDCTENRRMSWTCHFENDFLSIEIPSSAHKKKECTIPSFWAKAKMVCHLCWLGCIGNKT